MLATFNASKTIHSHLNHHNFIHSLSGLAQVGGYEGMRYMYNHAVPSVRNGTCGDPSPYAMNLIRPHDDPQYPWTGTIFGLTVSGVWYWCSDQASAR